jgi:hypothetical protein
MLVRPDINADARLILFNTKDLKCIITAIILSSRKGLLCMDGPDGDKRLDTAIQKAQEIADTILEVQS